MKPILFSAALFGALTTLVGAAADSSDPFATPATPALVQVTKKIDAFFPARLLRHGVREGEAVLAIRLDQSGHLADHLVTRYTHQEFADAASHAIKQWEFKLREQVGVVMEVIFLFRLDGVLAVERFGGDNPLAASQDGGYAYRPCAPADLDRPPKPTVVVAPQYPASFAAEGIERSVLINFYIDEEGRARLPVPVSQENSVLGGLATAAVEQWRFEPPTRKGKPVLVRASQRFRFESNK